ncbi:glycoside hydrolase family 125 protein [Dothidotthia symphoricarpi CBS 119687]|uniref:Glycoside hydrolase family 125 protein n=1 Tax=Dothidotthia symphoricarpi CBS 119687 TaxID=1392245 RepID=A0A6A6AF35_9PLEO|nr:glycoside hydrolase family 125 protein [Dothidotthia symphoricarpi CBS 119687]KAF2129547.1 glycoside hydrolase family 125 protein [Dothidotthia symphoricarpi CBS 119687]
MRSSSALLGTLLPLVSAGVQNSGGQDPMRAQIDPNKYQAACPDYKHYAMRPHPPYSEGPLELPFQRPAKYCRTFESPLVEKVIKDMNKKMVDKDLARIFENAFPNTLDTTVRWHVDGTVKHKPSKRYWDPAAWQGPQSFIVTGDINAEWLRDSTNQLAQYQLLAKKDKDIHQLILGAINTQAEYVIGSPYCNAFQPPPPSGLNPTFQSGDDNVHPAYEPSFVFECKYELDSLAHFLSLSNQFHNHTGSTEFVNGRWLLALDTLLDVLTAQSKPTFNEKTSAFQRNEYTFQRHTNIGTETLSLSGVGNPLNSGTGLVRSAFRPSDDATILGFFIPANAMIAVELERTAQLLEKSGKKNVAELVSDWGKTISKGVWEHGVVQHKKYGEVFAFEVDGYGSSIIMDDANLPSLLALPLLGFVDTDNKVYQNTRKMILEKSGNPYYLTGKHFGGIGGPHVGLQNAWPMSVLVQAMTSDDDDEITECLAAVKRVSRLGLVHETINVNHGTDYTRSWFAWANSVFAQTILDLAQRKPHLLFGKGAEPYTL